MRIAFATIYDPQDVTRGSGTFFHMSQEIERQGHEVVYIGPIDVKEPWPTRICRGIGHRLGYRYKTYLDPFVGWRRGTTISQQLQHLHYDVLLTNDYGIAANTRHSKRTVVYTDVMLPLDYPNGIHALSRSANLFPVGVTLFQYTIRRALDCASLCVFPAEWAARYALQYAVKYRIDPSKIVVLPFGANVHDPGREITEERCQKSSSDDKSLNLLFVGKEWGRKGGEIAFETVKALRNQGIKAMLHVVGATPSLNPSYALVHGYLDKSKADELAKLEQLYQLADVFILPSYSEGFVISVLEAAAYGLPVIAYRSTGVADAVKDQVSGRLLEQDRRAEDFANILASWYYNPQKYQTLVRGARLHYEQTTNWAQTIRRLTRDIEQRVL